MLTSEQMRSLLERIPARTPLELRDRAMLELAYSCGLRCEEIVNLDVGALDFETEQLRVLGKGSKERLLPVGEPAQRALRALPASAAATPSPTDPRERALFLSKSGRRLSNSDVTRRLGLWTREAALAARRLPALASSFIRHPSARGRRRPAYDSGAARPRIDLDHPGLHPGRCGPPARHLCRQPPSCINAAPVETDRRIGRTGMETGVKEVELRDLWRRYKDEGDDDRARAPRGRLLADGQVRRRPPRRRACPPTSKTPT